MFYFRGTRKPDFKSIKFFDYDEYWRLRGLKLRRHLREREELFIDWVKEGSKVLDIACGDAPVLLELKQQKNCQVEGSDISPLILSEQEKHNIPTFVSNISSEDFKLEKQYDYVILSELLEHLVHPEKFLGKIRHNTKYLIISIPNSAFYRYRTDFLVRGRFFTQWVHHPSEHVRFWSHIDFLDWLKALDLEVVKCEASNGLRIGPIKLFNFWKNLFGHQICYLVKVK
jgi:methionine biosynthesis protein MetW